LYDFDVKNILKLETELNSIRIGTMKLYANLLRYKKYEGGAQKVVHET